MSRTAKVILTTYLSFITYFFLDETFFQPLRDEFYSFLNQYGLSHFLAYALVGTPVFVGLYVMHTKDNIWKSLGLNSSFLMAFLFALLCTLPMFIGFALFFDFTTEIELNVIIISVISAGLFEELYFRGFLFGQVFRFTKLGFFPAVLLGALLFGFVHLYQSTAISDLAGIFLITFIGGLIFSWVYAEWDYNLYVPILLHIFMNLSWELFNISDNALGSVYANIFRLITVILIIVLTLWRRKHRGIKLNINRYSLLLKP